MRARDKASIINVVKSDGEAEETEKIILMMTTTKQKLWESLIVRLRKNFMKSKIFTAYPSREAGKTRKKFFLRQSSVSLFHSLSILCDLNFWKNIRHWESFACTGGMEKCWCELFKQARKTALVVPCQSSDIIACIPTVAADPRKMWKSRWNRTRFEFDQNRFEIIKHSVQFSMCSKIY